MKEFICIVCPKGCHLKVEDEGELKVSGNGCERGQKYAVAEITNPTRVVTSTVEVKGGDCPRCPVKTKGAIPKDLIFKAMEEINKVVLTPPVKEGAIIIKNILGTGIDVTATKSV